MRIAAAFAALALALLAGCSGTASTASSDGTTVSATDHKFTPATLQVAAGTEVTWTNDGQAPHTVSIEPPGGGPYLIDRNIEAGESTAYTFSDPGTFHVVCVYHTGMVMDVTVT